MFGESRNRPKTGSNASRFGFAVLVTFSTQQFRFIREAQWVFQFRNKIQICALLSLGLWHTGLDPNAYRGEGRDFAVPYYCFPAFQRREIDPQRLEATSLTSVSNAEHI